jgi:2-octaprenyl-6-methoxyphenol hydroxylase
MQHELWNIVIAGGGLAGLTAAAALGAAGEKPYLLAPYSEHHDGRTTAVFPASQRLLANIGVWPHLAGHSAAITTIRLIDDMGGLLKAPEVVFRAEEIGLDALAYNVENGRLATALRARLASMGIESVPVPLQHVTPARDGLRVALADGRALETRLLIGADGRTSPCRTAAGITARAWSYEQTAIVCNLVHSRSHRDTSVELHRPAGPLTTVPLAPGASSLVWVERPEVARRLLALPEAGFNAALEAHLHGMLGAIRSSGSRAAFPLSGLSAAAYGRARIALIGEAAHAFPPIGAQGLNLTLRDVATLTELVTGVSDPGADSVLARYDAARRADALSRTFAVDLLNRSLISGLMPLTLARGAGLVMIERVPALKRALMEQGLAPADLPRLMRTQPEPTAEA